MSRLFTLSILKEETLAILVKILLEKTDENNVATEIVNTLEITLDKIYKIYIGKLTE